MFRKLAAATAILMGITACSESDDGPNQNPVVDAGLPTPDLGFVVLPDAGFLDTGPRPDTGYADAGPRPDTGPEPDAGAPPDEVEVTGRVLQLGQYLGDNVAYVSEASVLAFGVAPPPPPAISVNNPPGAYDLTLPANGQALMVTTKAGYFQTFYPVTTTDEPLTRNLYIAEAAWLSEIATAHNVNLGGRFPCQTDALPNQQCVYAAIVGRILDDGTVGNGEIRPVAGVSADDFTVYGPNDNADWYKKGPYFLDYTGTSSVGAQDSIVYNDNGDYRGGLYIVFVEVPAGGAIATPFRISIAYPAQPATRYFGPVSVQAIRSFEGSVQFVNIRETGTPPPPPVNGIDFDTQVYPLFLAVNQGGLGCVGCHTNQGGATPAGGMNLYGGPAEAYLQLDPVAYPDRVNVANPADSLLLVRPLYEPNGIQDHPIFAFTGPQDPAYQLIFTWISEGALRNNNNLPPVSFYNDVRPLLYQPTNNGGAGCYACHVNGVDATNAPGGFYMGGDGNALYEQLTNVAPNNAGPYDEAYRINKLGYPERSLVLTNPLFNDAEPHPVKIFSDAADPRYQLIFRWIAEGYVNDTP